MRIVFSIGDIHGIGPEIILKSVLSLSSEEDSYVVTGSFRVLEFYRNLLGLPVELQRIGGVDDIATIAPKPG
ncbi:MAG TPA: 4-hydroxythreonine-4-phosphate dehydrogenase PdxA, partial [Chlorobaculum parvum]|nr:4-hydroxythreonine-4-phosphate dehydrogenase PdxA [Chlorobaculum parvum]